MRDEERLAADGTSAFRWPPAAVLESLYGDVDMAQRNTNDPSAEPPDQQPTFEQALAQLEEIVHELEEGQIGLNEALARYEQGVKLLRQCYELLQRAERKIELLSGLDAEGNPVTEPFRDDALSLDEKAQSRSRRRTAPGPSEE
jgi:exodeoxyribonuclease VII small subunit